MGLPSRIFKSAAILLPLVTALAGCGKQTSQGGNVAILVSQTRQSTGADVSLRNSPIGSVAQSFSLPSSSNVNQVQLKLYVEGTRPAMPSGFSVTVTIEGNTQVSGMDRPSGQLVDPGAKAKIDFDKIAADAGSLYPFVFASAFPLPKGGPYWIHLNADYPTSTVSPFNLSWVGSNDNTSDKVGTTVYEVLTQPGTYFNGLGANQSMYFLLGGSPAQP